ncbi:hypothetical protein NLX62_07160, partial [Mycobacteriaceae bacterium Msp059]|nr:hypothetical protein [Mycobacteriaceae bacterium Msp059]
MSGPRVLSPEVFEDEAADRFDVGKEAVPRTGENHRVRPSTPRDFRGRLRIMHLTRPSQGD